MSSPTSELMVLAGIANYPSENADIAFRGLTAEHFSSPFVLYFNGLKELYDQDKGISADLLKVHLERSREVLPKDFMTKIAKIVSTMSPTPRALESHIQTLKDEHARRKIEEVASNMVKQRTKKVLSVAADAVTELLKITTAVSSSSFSPISEGLEGALERFTSGKAPQFMWSGFRSLDAILGGFRAGNLCLVAARPAVGKTVFATTIALNMALRQGIPVAFLALEMGREEMLDRMVAALGHVSYSHVRSNQLSDSETDSVVDALGQLGSPNLLISDNPVTETTELKSRIATSVARSGVKVIVIDYIGLIDTSFGSSSYERLSYVSKTLKRLALEYNVLIIAVAQLNRASAETERPRMHHLRDSGQLEQDANQVILLSRSQQNENIVIADVAKNRHGAVGAAEIYFKMDTQEMYELEKGGNVSL